MAEENDIRSSRGSECSLIMKINYIIHHLNFILTIAVYKYNFVKISTNEFQPSIRQESCQGLYRLCLGKTSDGQTGYKYLILTFNNLLPCLADACSLKPAKKSTPGISASFGKVNIRAQSMNFMSLLTSYKNK